MNTLKFIPIAALAAIATVACNSGADDATNGADGRVEVRFSANTAEIRTRVNNDSWDGGDPVGIYMIDAASGLAPGNIVESVDNRPYEASAIGSDVSFTPVGGAIYYPMSGNVEFIAYHPYKSPLTDFELPVSVADQSDQSDIDVLYAPKTTGGYNKSTNPVKLQFTHSLVKLEFTINKGEGVIEPLDGLTVNITGQQTAATLNLTSGTVIPEGTAAAITAKTTANGSSSEAIVLPNSSVSGMTFTFTTATAAGGVYEVTVPTPAATNNRWESGYQYAYTVTLKRNEAEITGTVSAWGDGGSYNGRATPRIVAIEGYSGDINVQYSNASATIAANDINSKNVGNTVKSIILADHGRTYLIGRVVDPDNPIRLKFDETTGKLLFRDASADGFIPIGSYAEFQLIYGLDVRDGKYRLEADLDLMNEEWRPIAVKNANNNNNWHFYGEFDGAGKKISNLWINRSSTTSDQGLFRGNYGTIRNVHIVSGTITAGSYCGGICLVNESTAHIISCSNAATVSGAGYVGGIVGLNQKGGTVTACYNTGKVSGSGSYIGGVTGQNVSGSTVTACYNTGAVSGSSNFGSVVGNNNGSTVTACYWKSGTATNGIGSGSGDVTSFDPYFNPTGSPAWNTGNGDTNGYWKAGTTDGSQLPKLWFE